MRIVKPVLFIFAVVFLFSLVSAQDVPVETTDTVEHDKLDKHPVEMEFTDEGIRFENEYVDKKLGMEEVLIPDSYASELSTFNYQFLEEEADPDEDLSLPVIVNYGFSNLNDVDEMDENVEDVLSNYVVDAESELLLDPQENLDDHDPDDVLEFRDSKIQVEVYSHYEYLVIEYEIVDEELEVVEEFDSEREGYVERAVDGEVVGFERDVYKAGEPEKVAFTKDIERDVDEGIVTQEITRDNLFGEEEEQDLVLVYDERAEIEDLDFNARHQICDEEDFEDYRQELLDAGVDEDFVLDDLEGYEISCYSVDVPDNDLEKFEITYSYPDPAEEGDEDFILQDNPEYYSYVVGSGGAARFMGDTEICGTIDGYQNIIIDQSVDLCGSLTLDAEDTIRIDGTINGWGEDGEEDGESGESGVNVNLNAHTIEQSGTIDLGGGWGASGSFGDGQSGGDGGNAGDLTVDAFRYYQDGSVILSGGNGGRGGSGDSFETDDGGHGGSGGRGGDFEVDAVFYHRQDIAFLHSGAGASGGDGSRGGWGGDGGWGGTAGDFIVDAYLADMDTGTSLSMYGGNGGSGGSGSEGEEIDIHGGGGWGGEGGPGGEFELNARHLHVESWSHDAKGGDGGDGGDDGGSDEDGGDGGDGQIGGGVISEGHGFNLTVVESDFDSRGGDGGEGQDGGDGGSGGSGGDIDWFWEDTETVEDNEWDLSGGSHEDAFGSADSGDWNVEQEDGSFKSGAVDMDSLEENVFSRDSSREFRIPEGENITAEWEFIVYEDEDVIDNVEIELFNEQEELVEEGEMNLVRTEQVDEGYEYEYDYDFDVPIEEDSAGSWFVSFRATDEFGDEHLGNTDFIYQYVVGDHDAPSQRSAILEQEIAFDQIIRYQNPSNTTYEDVRLDFELIDGATMDFVELEDTDDNLIEIDIHPDENRIEWNWSEIEAGNTTRWDLLFDLEAIEPEVVEEEFREEEGREIAEETFVIENPSDDIIITDIEAFREFIEPERTIDAELWFEDEEITEDEEWNVFFEDERGDGMDDTVYWDIDVLEINEPQEYTVVTDLGEPIQIYEDRVITNRPVEEGKPIQWRDGYAFHNPNEFTVPYSERLRVPISASNIRIDGELRQMRFDEFGSYVLFERNLPSGANETGFVEYETSSISTTEDVDRPSRFVVDRNDDITREITIENLVDQEIHEVEYETDIDYGENIEVVDADSEEVIQENNTGREGYEFVLDSIGPSDVRNIEVNYDIPNVESQHLRDGVSEDGNELAVYRVHSNWPQPLENVWFVEEDIDCTEVETVYAVGLGGELEEDDFEDDEGMEADFDPDEVDVEEIDDYECGSTEIPLNRVNPDQVIHLGIEYREVDPEIEEIDLRNMLIAGGKWVAPVGIIIILLELGSRIVGSKPLSRRLEVFN